jgi:hypothetical protein
MKKAHLITRTWFVNFLKSKLKKTKKEVIPLSQILANTIKMQAHPIGGGRVRFS